MTPIFDSWRDSIRINYDCQSSYLDSKAFDARIRVKRTEIAFDFARNS